MLSTLRIKNLALVEDLTLELPPGLVVITGETGAGKSIIIGALDLVLGERADRDLLRAGAEGCTVEAVFDVSGLRVPLAAWLHEHGIEPCECGQLMLKRMFTAAGTNRQFVNGTPATLALLGELGQWLVDMHGPHDHQSLLHPARQLAILDAFGGLEAQRAQYAALVDERANLLEKKTLLIVDDRTYAQQLDLLRFQVREISEARLQADGEAALEQEYRRATNAARLLELTHSALAALGEDEGSILSQAAVLGRAVQELQRIDSSAEALLSTHEQALTALRDLQALLRDYSDRVELDPERLRACEERLNLIQSLRRKYGTTVSDVIAFGEAARKRLDELEQRDAELDRLNTQLKSLEAQIERAGRELSASRKRCAPKLSQAAARQLLDLGFKQARFDVTLTCSPPAFAPGTLLSSSGFDAIEFQFSPNPGEPLRPLRVIASSGEMARVMLALKTVLAVQDEIPVLIFDEVDANVGGETAHAVGEKMSQVAAHRQVLCITHLAPVAAAARAHFLVSKEVSGGRTVSTMRQLERPERVTELARMLGGQSDAARRHAAALLSPGARHEESREPLRN